MRLMTPTNCIIMHRQTIFYFLPIYLIYQHRTYHQKVAYSSKHRTHGSHHDIRYGDPRVLMYEFFSPIIRQHWGTRVVWQLRKDVWKIHDKILEILKIYLQRNMACVCVYCTLYLCIPINLVENTSIVISCDECALFIYKIYICSIL